MVHILLFTSTFTVIRQYSKIPEAGYITKKKVIWLSFGGCSPQLATASWL